MGNDSEEGKQPTPEKRSPPPTVDLNSVHVYPDWAAMQAFYGPRLAVRSYLNSAVGSTPPTAPYMWASAQSMIPHYGAPYAAFCTHYSHPGVTMVSAAAISTESPGKASGNTDGGFIKKLKEFDGLTMSIGNGNGDNSEQATRSLSDSEETGGSSDGSNGVLAAKIGTKRSRNGVSKGYVEAVATNSLIPAAEFGQASEKMVDMIPAAEDSPSKKLENMSTALELKDRSLNVKSSPTNVSQQSVPGDTCTQQNERELKRERRKQSNRESARRSRLRKQAETEELAIKVQALTSDNMTLKSEIDKLLDNSEKLKLENAALKGKLKDAQLGQSDCPNNLHKMMKLKPIATVNLLARVNNSGTVDRNNEDGDPYETRSPRAMLHQLLDSSARGDAVAAS